MTASSSKRHSEKGAARFIGVRPGTLAYWRWADVGPPYLKLGGRVAYLEADLIAWLQSCRRVPGHRKEACVV
jgi:hypothetical protein